MSRQSLRFRVSVGFAGLVLLMVIVLGWLAFEAMLGLEDRVLARVLSAVLGCSEDGRTIALECLGARAGIPAGAGPPAPSGLVEVGDVDYVVDAHGALVLPAEPFEVLDPFESTFGVLVGAGVLAVSVLALVAALILTRVVLLPVTALGTLVEQTPPEALGQVLAERTLPQEVRGLRDRLVRTLALVEATTRRERLLSRYIGHELRTPLAVARAATELLEEPRASEAMRARARGRLTRAHAEMSLTIDTVLALSRSRRSAPTGRVSVLTLASEEVERLAGQARERGISLTVVEQPPSPPPASQGPARIILRNLLWNALRHSKGTAIVVHVEPLGFAVVDDGRGIAPEDVPRLMRPFQSEARDGYGLGLSLVRDLCEREGWPFVVEPATGGGVRARVRVLEPLGEDQPAPEREALSSR